MNSGKLAEAGPAGFQRGADRTGLGLGHPRPTQNPILGTGPGEVRENALANYRSNSLKTTST